MTKQIQANNEVFMLTQRPSIPRISTQKGLSLIELMIASTLGLLLLTGVIQIFLSSKQAYGTVSGASQTLDNGRLSMHFLSSSIGKAGYWGDVTQTPRIYFRDTTVAFNHSGASNAPYSDSYNGVFAEQAYVFGADNDNTDPNVVNGTDQLWLRFNGHDIFPQFNCAGEPVSSTQVAYERYYVSVPDPNATALTPSLVCETSIMNFSKITGESSPLANPIITTVPLISGIENMQILFAEADTIDVDTAQILYRIAPDVTDWSLVVGVRIAVLAASETEVNSVTRNVGYDLLDVTTNAPADFRARRVFEQTIALRNLYEGDEN